MKFLIQKLGSLEIKKDVEFLKIDQDCLLIYVGIEKGDEDKDLFAIVKFLENLEIIESEGKFSKSVKDSSLVLIFVSQITLLANFDKRGRLNFNQALNQDLAKKIFNDFVKIWKDLNYNIYNFEFGSFLIIKSMNIGPVNFYIEI